MRPCATVHVTPEPDQCRVCWLHAHDPRYRKLWGGSAVADTACAFLGPATGEEADCPTCNQAVRVKTFVCGLHGQCTVGKAVPGLANCRCPDFILKAV